MSKDAIRNILREDINKNILGVVVTRPDQELVIMRGVPGSGKSTEGKKLVGEGIVHSTDTLIEMRGEGAYALHFATMVESGDWSAHSRVHNQNFLNAKASMLEGISPVIVDNTNIKANEPKKYVEAALKMGFDEANIKIVDVGTGGCTVEVLAERNTHNVPLATIKKMAASHKGVGPLTVKKILESKDMYKKSKIAMLVLDANSKNKLITALGNLIPDGWKLYAHHMTINFGKGLSDELRGDLGQTKSLTATAVGLSDMAMAVHVVGYHSDNKIPHITVAVNVEGGGKPVMSNDIPMWKTLEDNYNITPIKLSGVVVENELG